MKDSWISLLVILICIAVIVLGAFNAATYGKIANENKTVGDVTPGGARALMWINIIICVLFLIPIFVYGRKFYYSGLQGRTFSWINLMIILLLIALIILSAFNAATYGKIANENKTVGDVTPGGARALMVINIILCIIFVIPLGYYIYKAYQSPDNPPSKKSITEVELGGVLRPMSSPSPKKAMIAEQESDIALQSAIIAEEKAIIADEKAMIALQTRNPADMMAARKAAIEAEEAIEATRQDELNVVKDKLELLEEMKLPRNESKQDEIMDYLRRNIKTIDDADAAYDTLCNPFNPLRSRKCD